MIIRNRHRGRVHVLRTRFYAKKYPNWRKNVNGYVDF